MRFGFFFREALRALSRNAVPSFAAVATVLVTVLVLGVFIPVVQATTGAANKVRARVIAKDPNLWYDQVTNDKGSGSGIERNQAVVNGQGLVGRVTEVTGSTAIVTLITNHTTQIGGKVSDSGVQGLVGVEAGHPTDLVLGSLSSKDEVTRGQIVVTAGTTSKVDRFPSPSSRS